MPRSLADRLEALHLARGRFALVGFARAASEQLNFVIYTYTCAAQEACRIRVAQRPIVQERHVYLISAVGRPRDSVAHSVVMLSPLAAPLPPLMLVLVLVLLEPTEWFGGPGFAVFVWTKFNLAP